MGRRPRRPDQAEITFTASVRARELRFGEAPQTSTEFTGTPDHDSGSGSDRVNVPERVEKDVTYRQVRVDYRLASALLDLDEGTQSPPGHSGQATARDDVQPDL